MAIADTKQFSFVSGGLPEDTFSVVTFKGTEGISRLYEFDVTLASDDPDIDLKEILQNPSALTIHGSDQTFPIHGILAQFEQLHEVKGNYFYRALLVPRLWQADLYHENQLFLDKSVPDIIAEILRQTGLTTQDYELKLTKKYHPWEYICQFRETDFDFISRWMEREGIYYFFEQGEQNEKLIITDNATAHKDIAGMTSVPYSPPSGLAPEEEAIKAFFCRQKRLPNKVILSDYNYRKPSLELKADTVVDTKGRGNVYFYGEHFKTPEEGHTLAKVRAEEIRCRENLFHGEGTQPALCPGFTFEIAGHYRESYNQKYLIAEIEHQGGQAKAFMTGSGDELTEGEQQPTYTNAFTAIPAGVQFRPERNTTKPRFYGTMNAKVDAAGIGQYAEIDDEGRYKVKLPFDQNGNGGGKASRWVRMVQPYAGADHGMHFPLHKGTEVLLTFVDGDPDRPIIAGAVPNAETKSVVTSLNSTRNTIRSAGGNMLEMQDMAGMERVLLSTPHEDSYLHLGAPNSPKDPIVLNTKGAVMIRAGKRLKKKVGKSGDKFNYEETIEPTGKLTENICEGKYQQTIEDTGDLTETVEGNKTETVKKDYSGTIEGNKAETVKKDYTGTVEGNQAETVNGNKTETIKGNKTVTIDGVQNVTVNGNRSMRFKQPSHDEYGSISSEVVYGLKNSVFIGGSNSTDLALARSNFCGAKIEHFLGLKLETLLAAAISIKSGINLEIGETLDYEMKGVKIEQKGTELKKNLAEISHKLMVVHSGMKIHT
ncbi:MAG: type VI secretion system tip protein TssI/VgrG [Desulfobacterales bacterium]|jgi:type VI secretion system secreted protein VgrG